MARALKIDESVTTCDCCGKVNLKQTVLMELDDGARANYGTTCAARNSGKSQKEIRAEIAAKTSVEKSAIESRAMTARAEYRASQEFIALSFAEASARKLGLIGRSFKDFCAIAREADYRARNETAAKHSVPAFML
jgi:hypothetical protein